MKIVITGATGFVGSHLVKQLLMNKHEIIAVSRSLSRFNEMSWRDQVRWISCDIHADPKAPELFNEAPDILIHLAWPGLPNYKDRFHFEKNLPLDYLFLKNAVESGIGHLLITGTVAEYGMQSGCLAEDFPTFPANSYGIAKDSLRRYLQYLQLSYKFTLQWVRLFHMYGPRQNPTSILAQLDKAIDEKALVFNMSRGEQLLDYLPVEKVAWRLAQLVDRPDCEGVINCCSGTPVSVRRLVERHIEKRGASILLNLGHYPYLDHETMAYWGNPDKINSILQPSDDAVAQ